MKKTVVCTAVAFLLLRFVSSGAAPIDGWTLEVSGGQYWDPSDLDYPLQAPYPFDPVTANPYISREVSVTAQSVFLYSFQTSSWLPFTTPDGNSYYWVPDDYTLSAVQTLHLLAGEKVSGWATFASQDLPGYADFASVTIDGSVIWRYDLNNLGNQWGATPYSWKGGPRQYWEFIAPADGTYSLALNLYGDDQFDSSVAFNGISVPESSSLTFDLTLGGLALATSKRCRAILGMTG